MGRLQNRVALVTGAASDLGMTLARAFAHEGADLVLHYEEERDRAVVSDLVRDIQTSGRRILAVKADITDNNGAYGVLENGIAGMGHIDILVNNAGLRPSIPFADTTADQFDLVMAVNVRSAFMITRMLLPLMFAQNYGRIITTVSDIAYHGAAGGTLAGAASGALLGFTRSLVHDIGPRNVTANCVAPGALEPKLTTGTARAAAEAYRRSLPSQRLGQYADVVPAYVFLASEEARHMVGQCISPSGGAVML